MTPPPVRLRAAPGTQHPDLAEVVAQLEASFRVHVGPRTDVRRTGLDTFDRRLAAARLRLVHQVPGVGRRNGVLLLEGPSGEELVADADGLTTPLMAADLPPGRLRDAVAPSMGIRALVADAEHRRRVRRAELRNDDDKLVGALDLDEPASASSEDPTEVTVRPLRGYDREAKRAVRALRRCGLVVDESDPALPEVQVPPPDFSPSTPATELLAQVFGGFLAAMRANIDGLVADVDTEFLHDYRVAVRRTRSTLKLSRTVLPEGMARRWEPEFKWLGDLTTPVRDLDVYELDLPTMSSWLVGASPADLAPFAAHLRRRRTKERRALLRGLRSARAARLLTDWDHALEELSGVDASDVPTARELAARSIR